MSSGWNGIGIKNVGRTRYRLAEMIFQVTGVIVEAENIDRTNPWHRHYEDCCAWSVDGIRPAKVGKTAMQVNVYSWDTMSRCVKNGIEEVKEDYQSIGGISPYQIEVNAKT